MFAKSLQRVSTRATRSMTKRFTSYQTGKEGATASTGGFGKKEKAVENQWARSHDADKLKLLREALQKQEKDTAALKKDLEALEQKHQSK